MFQRNSNIWNKKIGWNLTANLTSPYILHIGDTSNSNRGNKREKNTDTSRVIERQRNGILSKMKESRWLFPAFVPRIDSVEHSYPDNYFTNHHWNSTVWIYALCVDVYVFKIRYREGWRESEERKEKGLMQRAGRIRKPKIPKTGTKGRHGKEIASHAKSRTSMQPPNQSSIDTIDSLPFQPATTWSRRLSSSTTSTISTSPGSCTSLLLMHARVMLVDNDRKEREWQKICR